MFGMSFTLTRSPTLKRPAAAFLVVSFAFMTSLHLRDLVEQFVQRDVLFGDQHPGRGPNPAPVIWHAHVERIAEIVISSPAPLFSVPEALPAEHLAGHVGIQFPLFLFLFLVADRNIGLTPNVMGRVHVGAEQGWGVFVVPGLRGVKRRLERRYDVVLLMKLRRWRLFLPFFVRAPQ